MSYDIHLVLVGPEEDIREAACRDQISEPPYTSEAKLRNSNVAQALMAKYPAFARFESESHVELTDLNGGTGIQVHLFADSGAISIPYWHDQGAAQVLRKVDDVLSIVLQNSPFRAFDPQTGQELVSGALSQASAESVYSVGSSAVKRMTKPWWQFWK